MAINTISINDRLGPGGLENVGILSTDANGNTGLVGAVGSIVDLNLTPTSFIDGRFVDGQPTGITRPVTKGGKLVCRFVASECTASGLATLADHTGYDAN